MREEEILEELAHKRDLRRGLEDNIRLLEHLRETQSDLIDSEKTSDCILDILGETSKCLTTTSMARDEIDEAMRQTVSKQLDLALKSAGGRCNERTVRRVAELLMKIIARDERIPF